MNITRAMALAATAGAAAGMEPAELSRSMANG